MNKKEIQLLNEMKFSEVQVREKHREYWYVLFEEMFEKKKHLGKEVLLQIRDTAIRVLYVLAESKTRTMMYHNLIECLISKSNRSEEITYLSMVLDLGIEFELWTYDQLPVRDNALKVRALYQQTEEFYQDMENCIKSFPMVIKPRKVRNHKHNRGSGYLLKEEDSLLLGSHWYKGDLVREHLDRLNSIGFKLNTDFLELCGYRMTEDDNQLNQEELDVLMMYRRHMAVIEKELVDTTFYFTHKYDCRGRCYPQAIELSYVGNGFNKATTVLAKQEVVSEVIEFFQGE